MEGFRRFLKRSRLKPGVVRSGRLRIGGSVRSNARPLLSICLSVVDIRPDRRWKAARDTGKKDTGCGENETRVEVACIEHAI